MSSTMVAVMFRLNLLTKHRRPRDQCSDTVDHSQPRADGTLNGPIRVDRPVDIIGDQNLALTVTHRTRIDGIHWVSPFSHIHDGTPSVSVDWSHSYRTR